MNKRMEALNLPTSVDDLTLIEVLKEEFNISANDINGTIQLPEGVDMPSDEEIAAAKETLLAKYQGNEYSKKRGITYPEIKQQLDALYHDIVNGNLNAENSTFVSMIKAVKDEYPKSGE
jgi:hypothetical protein